MPKSGSINYEIVENTPVIQKLITANLIVGVPCGHTDLIVAAKGVNKTALKKISKKELERQDV